MSVCVKTVRPACYWAKKFFANAERAGKTRVANTDLFAYVSARTGQVRSSLNGTLDGTGPGKIAFAKWYKDKWHKEHEENGRITHVFGKVLLQREMSFDTPSKKATNTRIMGFLPPTGTPRLLTLPSSQGGCVQAAIKHSPGVVIDTIELDPDIQMQWKLTAKKLGIKTTDFCMKFQDFVGTPFFRNNHYALVNADAMGYAGLPMYTYLSALNKLKNADIIALTTQKLGSGFRNGGPFQDSLRSKYKGNLDAHAQCIIDWLPDYRLVDRFDYQKMAGSKRMEVFIFQLK